MQIGGVDLANGDIGRGVAFQGMAGRLAVHPVGGECLVALAFVLDKPRADFSSTAVGVDAEQPAVEVVEWQAGDFSVLVIARHLHLHDEDGGR